MTDTELFALAVYVQSERLFYNWQGEQPISVVGEAELESELKRRGVLPGGKG